MRFQSKIIHFRLSKAFRILVCAVLCILTLSGFKAPSPEKIKQDLKKELEKIKELSPRAKMRKVWLTNLNLAKEVRKKALYESAEGFAPKLFKEGEYLLNLSYEYAKKGEYRKAEYLARKAKDAFDKALEAAKENRAQEIKKREEAYKKIKKRIEELEKSRDKNRVKELSLQAILLNQALKAEDLEEFDKLKRSIEKRLSAFKKAD
ncbi:hypothetical protein DBT_1113 [Dissulfuribacter thermophilus]|uniref:DUF4398 domain-containing protein n=1 Tax=Dissulfuribacter thermophilus TaxID=1156395 RepID=A0A1B9F616_9BACT|nr:hypothetical protein [Dissulfuribacter thermophilus]OCC15366.1 hypothetical protein DBT_1113 [Dissulfuribacter thermophilus]